MLMEMFTRVSGWKILKMMQIVSFSSRQNLFTKEGSKMENFMVKENWQRPKMGITTKDNTWMV